MMKINHLSQLQTSMVDSYGTQIGTSSRGGFAGILQKHVFHEKETETYCTKKKQRRIEGLVFSR